MSDPGDVKVINMKEWMGRNEGLIEMIEFMLAQAKKGNVVGVAGTFLIREHGEDNGPAVGQLITPNMKNHAFAVLGSLEQIKFKMLAEITE